MQERPGSSNGDYSNIYVTREEQHHFANHVLEAVGGLTAEIARLSTKVERGFAEQQRSIEELRKSEEGVRRKVRSLPNLVAEAVDQAEEITSVRELKRELAETKKAAELRRKRYFSVLSGIAVLLVGTVAAAIVLRLLHI